MDRVIAAFRSCDLDYLLTVPASGLDPLYADYDRRGRCIYATREEEAVALAAGLATAGARPVVVMQQSGVGNALNAVFTLCEPYGISFPIVVFDRGANDVNPIHKFSSERTEAVLRALGVTLLDWGAPDAEARFGGALARLSEARFVLCRDSAEH